MSRKVVAMVMMVMMGAASFGAYRASEDFTGASYEGDALPTLASTPWDFALEATQLEAMYASSNGNELYINSYPYMGAPLWLLPGAEGGATAPAANRHWAQPGDPDAVNNPWQPDAEVGYTVEARMRMPQVNPAYGVLAFDFYVGESTGGALFDIAFLSDKVIDSFGHVLYVGDLASEMHTFRFTRYGGGVADPEADPRCDFYVDGVLVFQGTRTNFSMVGVGPNQDWFYLGSIAGGTEFEAYVDYIRMDFTGAYTPEPATMILLGLGSLLLRRKH